MQNIMPGDPAELLQRLLSDTRERRERLVRSPPPMNRILTGFRLLAGEPDGIRLLQEVNGDWSAEITRIVDGRHVRLIRLAGPDPNLVSLMADAEEALLLGMVLRDTASRDPGSFLALPGGVLFPVALFRAIREDLWQVLEIDWTDDEFAQLLGESSAWEDWLLLPKLPAGRKRLWAWILHKWADDVSPEDPDVFSVAQERLLDDGFRHRPWPA